MWSKHCAMGSKHGTIPRCEHRGGLGWGTCCFLHCKGCLCFGLIFIGFNGSPSLELFQVVWGEGVERHQIHFYEFNVDSSVGGTPRTAGSQSPVPSRTRTAPPTRADTSQPGASIARRDGNGAGMGWHRARAAVVPCSTPGASQSASAPHARHITRAQGTTCSDGHGCSAHTRTLLPCPALPCARASCSGHSVPRAALWDTLGPGAALLCAALCRRRCRQGLGLHLEKG